jgi:peptidoglycan/LPS O-acetylase OafA/YrhL
VVSHKNNFDLLRFVFAFIVFLVHAHVLSQQPELAFLSRWLSTEFAVEAFFVVSGFLVVMSFERSRSMGDYFAKRARRIYPAYFVIVVGCALSGALITRLPLAEYFSATWIRYLVANLALLNFFAHELPGVFESNPVSAVNGALWTLKIEVMFYVCVPVIVLLCARFGRLPVLVALYVAAVAYGCAMDWLARETGRELYLQLARQLPGQLGFFVAGAAGYYFLDALQGRWRFIVAVALVVLLLPLPTALGVALRPAAMGALVVYLAVGLRYLGNFGRYGDMSYGVYIIHFPVVQTLVSLGLFQANPYAALALATAIVLLGAFSSWHLVEKPFLQKSSHYIVAERATEPA